MKFLQFLHLMIAAMHRQRVYKLFYFSVLSVYDPIHHSLCRMKLGPNTVPFPLFLLISWSNCRHLYCVFTFTYSLLLERDLCECRNPSVKFPHTLLVYLCLSSGDLFIFGESFPFLFLFFGEMCK